MKFLHNRFVVVATELVRSISIASQKGLSVLVMFAMIAAQMTIPVQVLAEAIVDANTVPSVEVETVEAISEDLATTPPESVVEPEELIEPEVITEESVVKEVSPEEIIVDREPADSIEETEVEEEVVESTVSILLDAIVEVFTGEEVQESVEDVTTPIVQETVAAVEEPEVMDDTLGEQSTISTEEVAPAAEESFEAIGEAPSVEEVPKTIEEAPAVEAQVQEEAIKEEEASAVEDALIWADDTQKLGLVESIFDAVSDALGIEDGLVATSVLELAQHAQEGRIIPELNDSGAPIAATFARDIDFVLDGMTARLTDGLRIATADGSAFDLTALNLKQLDNGEIAQIDENATAMTEFGIPGQHLTFNKPVQLTIPTDIANGTQISMRVQHAGQDITTKGITTNINASCNADGTSSNDNNLVTVQNGEITFGTCGASVFLVNIVTANLDIEYRFNNNLNDDVAPANNAINTGAIFSTDVPYPVSGNTHSIDFGTANTANKVLSTSNVGISGAAARTLCASVKFDTLAGLQVPVYWGGDSTGTNFGFYKNTSNNIVFWNHSAGDAVTDIFVGTEWNQYCFSYDGANVRGYFNGNLITSGDFAGGFAARALTTTDSVLAIGMGGAANGVDSFPFKGKVDDVLVYNRQLSDAEIAGAYTHATPGGVSSPTGDVSGLYFELYNGYDATPEDGITGTLQTRGYAETMNNLDDRVTNEGSNTFSIIAKTRLLAPETGIYIIRSRNTDDDVYIKITDDIGVKSIFGGGGSIDLNSVSLTAGNYYDFEVRFSENSGGETLQLQWDAPTGGFVTIPTENYFLPSGGGIESGQLGLWIKADRGMTPSTNASVPTTWTDSGPGGNNFTTVDNTTLRYDRTSGTPFNNNPSIFFSDARMDSVDDTTGLAWGQQGRTIFTVLSDQNTASGIGYVWAQGIDADDRMLGLTQSSGFNDLAVNDFNNNRAADGDFFTVNNRPEIARVQTISDAFSITNNSALYRNGGFRAGDTFNWDIKLNDGDDFTLGACADSNGFCSNGSDGFDGNIAEVIYYPWTLSSSETQKVESYLALKYGITLDSSAGNYRSSGGVSVYNHITSGGYISDIFGIAYDREGGLDQQISKSVNTGAVVTVSTDTDFTGVNGTHASLLDGQFLIISNNGGATTLQSTELDATTYSQRTIREWRVRNTGSVGAVNLKFDGFDDTYVLLTDTDGDFSTGATNVGTLSATGEITGVTLADGEYFTLATLKQIAPGAVDINLSLWFKADAGVTGGATVTSWADQSSNAVNLTVGTTQSSPAHTINGGLFNFNSSVDFIDGNRALHATIINGGLGATAGAMFTVYEEASTVAAAAGDNGSKSLQQSSIQFAYGAVVGRPGTAMATNIVGFSGAKNTIGNTYQNGASGTGSFGNVVTSNNFTIGSLPANAAATSYNFGSTGEVAETIIYSGAVTATEAQKIQSYLALKYGITLDQTTATGYLASDGTTKIWDETTNATYNKDIFGIGRDDAQVLDQRIAKSVNAGAIVTVENGGIDFTSANTLHTQLGTDMQFLTISNDGGATNTTSAEVSALYKDRVTREWQAQKTGSVGAVNLKFDGFDDTYVLLTDTDGDFSTGATNVGTLSATGEITGVTLADGEYFTLGKLAALIEFSVVTSSDAEATGGNLPVILVKGTVVNATTITITDAGAGTATNATDYTFTTPQVVTIPAGIYDGLVGTAIAIPTLSITDDTDVESDETIIVTMSTATGDGALGDANSDTATIASTTYTITNDDLGFDISGTLWHDASGDGVKDGAETIGLEGVTVTLYADVNNDNAYDAGDTQMVAISTDTNGDYVFPDVIAGEYVVVVDNANAALNGDANNASLTYGLTTSGETAMTVVAAAIPAQDFGFDDVLVTLSVDTAAIAENGSSAIITATRAPTAAFTTVVTLATTGTATDDADYEDAADNGAVNTKTITISGGAVATGTLTINSLADTLLEDDEIITVSITSVTGGAENGVQAVDITITDDETATVTLTANDATITETAGNAGEYTITLSSPNNSGGALTFNLNFSGSAGNGSDYTLVPSAIDILDGQTSAIVSIVATDDALVEGSETLTIEIATSTLPLGGRITAGAQIADTATITDNDATTVSISATDANGQEGTADTGEFTLALAAPVATNVVVTYGVTGTASNGTDYATIPTQATIIAGATSTTVTIDASAQDDTSIEGSETVIITLSSTDNISVTVDGTNNTGTVTLSDNDILLVEFVLATKSGSEAITAPVDGLRVIGGVLATNQSIEIAVTGGTATSTDHTFVTPKTIIIPAGDYTTVQSIDIGLGIVNDSIVEVDETIELTLQSPSSLVTIGDADGSTVIEGVQTYTITDEDVVNVEFTNATSSDLENSGGGFSTLSVFGGILENAASVVVSIIGGTATGGGDDYTGATSTTVTIAAGNYTTLQTIALSIFSIIGDTFFEADETIETSLGSANGVVIGDTDTDAVTQSTNTYAITNDDTTTVIVSATDAAAQENTDNGVFTLEMNAAAILDTVVNYTVTGTATAGSDFAALGGSATILTGATSTTITVDAAAFDDASFEGGETVTITITSTDQSNVTLGATTVATVTIADDETAPTIATATIVSDNTVSTTQAKAGDTLTMTLIFDTSVQNVAVNIAGVVATISGSGANYTAVVGPLAGTEAAGVASMTVNADALGGGTMVQVTTMTDASTVTLDFTAPITNPADPVMSPEIGVVGASVQVPAGSCGAEYANGTAQWSTTPAAQISPDPTIVALDASGDYVTTALDASGSTVAFTINLTCTDSAGNAGPTLAPAGGSYTPDHVAPIAPPVTAPANNGTYSNPMNIVTVCEAVGDVISISGVGITPDPTTHTCTATGATTISVIPTATSSPQAMSITATDLAGNAGTTTITGLEYDADGDGASNTLEDAGNNGGDGNGDGILDSVQSEVSTRQNPATPGKTASMLTTGGCNFIQSLTFLEEASLTTADADAEYPVGIADFALKCANPGESANVTIYYDQIYDTTGWIYKKYNSAGQVYSDITDIVTAGYATAIVGASVVTTVSFTVTDGDSRTDEDGLADGIITDPSGPSLPIPTVPTGGGGPIVGSGGSVAPSLYGCTDSTASNFVPSASIDNGSCAYNMLYGCKNVTAQNYNALALLDDGSCTYGAISNLVIVSSIAPIIPVVQQGPVIGTPYTHMANVLTGVQQISEGLEDISVNEQLGDSTVNISDWSGGEVLYTGEDDLEKSFVWEDSEDGQHQCTFFDAHFIFCWWVWILIAGGLFFFRVLYIKY